MDRQVQSAHHATHGHVQSLLYRGQGRLDPGMSATRHQNETEPSYVDDQSLFCHRPKPEQHPRQRRQHSNPRRDNLGTAHNDYLGAGMSHSSRYKRRYRTWKQKRFRNRERVTYLSCDPADMIRVQMRNDHSVTVLGRDAQRGRVCTKRCLTTAPGQAAVEQQRRVVRYQQQADTGLASQAGPGHETLDKGKDPEGFDLAKILELALDVGDRFAVDSRLSERVPDRQPSK